MPVRRVVGSERESLRWGAEKRLEFTELKLYWEGRINRGDLTRTFNISNPQASADFTRYMEKAPGNMDYDRSEKHYFATPRFRPAMIVPNADQYLMQSALGSLRYFVFMSCPCWPGIKTSSRSNITAQPLR